MVRDDGQRPRFPLMDALRAIAALSIVVYHGLARKGTVSGPAGELIDRLNIGVVMFFLITGFLLYRPFVAARMRQGPRPDVRRYARGRVLRIVPGYWVALLIAVPVLSLGDVLTPTGVPKYFGYLQVYFPGGSNGIPQAWTLCVEMSFYLLLPLLALLMRRSAAREPRAVLRSELALLAVLTGVGYITLAVLIGTYDGVGRLPPMLLTLPNWLDEFALGMGVAVASVWWADSDTDGPRVFRAIEERPGGCWIGAGAAFAVLSFGLPAFPDSIVQAVVTNLLQSMVPLLLLLPVVFTGDGRGLVRRTLNTRLLLSLGTVSYGIYLFHGIAFDLARQVAVDTASIPIGFSIGMGMTVAFATASWWLVERPALTLKDRRARAAPALAEMDSAAP